MALLPALDIHFTIRVEGPAPDLAFLGPTVRGLLGYGLRQSCCGHDADEQGRCSMGEACAYSYLFEGPLQRRMHAEGLEVDALPQPFITLVAAPNAAGAGSQRVTFGFRLVGNATALAPEVAAAILSRERFGFGARSMGFVLETVALARNPVWQRRQDPSADGLAEAIRRHAPHAIARPVLPDLPAGDCTLQWRFRTPVSLRSAAHGSNACFAARLLDAAGRRAWLLERAYGAQQLMQRSIPHPVDGRAFTTRDERLERFRIERRSTRHGRVVTLTGEVGTVSIHGPWREHAALLAAIQRYGVGQSTSFGFGQVEFEIQLDARRSVAAIPDSKPEPNPTPALKTLAHPNQNRSTVPRWVRLRGAPPTKPSNPNLAASQRVDR